MLMGLCLVMEAFFSGSEIGVVSADRLKLRHMAAKGSKGAQIAVDMLKKPEWLLSTTLVGTNIAIVSNSTLATLLAMELFGPKYSWMAIILVAPLIWVFGEIVPKSIFQQRADQLTPKVIYVLKFCSYLFFPLLIIFTTMTKLLTKLVGKAEKNPFTLREELDMMLQMDGEGDILPMEKDMLRRAFAYGQTKVREVMVPYIDVSSVRNDATVGETLEIASHHGHPLIPVYTDRVDRVVGQINTMDLLGEQSNATVKNYIKPIRFVYGSKSLEDLLKEFRGHGDRMAIVVDEFGSAKGLVTLKDLVERIVGEIESGHQKPSETDSGAQDIEQVDSKTYLLNPRLGLTALYNETGIQLPETGHYETLSGFLLERFGDIPAVGSEFTHDGITFVVVDRSSKRIERVRAELPS
ncbi:MAG: HlyC/CorC family transporter [Magnetococcales bacterium]|nr:HlyC/CorC family transporter [Magnetococcales bacterium]